MKLIAVLIAASVILTGCSGLNLTGPNYYVPPPRPTSGPDYSPVVDNAGPNHGKDLAECQEYARNAGDQGSSAASGAIGGALVGTALNLVAGGGHSAGYAGFGALAGGVGGVTNVAENQKQMIINCLRGRGYNVLG
ncbi:glycine zipper family protein [Nitrosospira lacus]|uniref:Glycine zipper family protein n=1 Tax=Nitrosospira lacus TaxID=1288494 RepID=A0A1W6SQN0_9PROT|nr:glycine zipper family protein [Nitrosospira lacus]ARO88138.1 glycine zipper family protein [Nitrosospira lacus]